MFQLTKTTVSLIYHHISTVSGMVCNVFNTLDLLVTVDENTENNSPTSCGCANSIFCSQSSGYIVSGHFHHVQNNDIKRSFAKGPKCHSF